MRQDLSQRRNLYAEKPEVVRTLKELLERYKRDGRSTPGAPQKNDEPPTGRTEKTSRLTSELL